ncbi:MAG: hypothetical protein ACYC2W_08880 [Desulfurivibrionaceae bacterium]
MENTACYLMGKQTGSLALPSGGRTEKHGCKSGEGVLKKRKWYEKYLPFVARSPEMQLRWLEAALRKEVLTPHEITPYIKLFMAPDGEGNPARVRGLLHSLSANAIEKMLAAADIYDVPDLFRCVAEPTVAQAVIAIIKAPPPYEKNPQLVVDKVFQAVYDCSEELLAQAAGRVAGSAERPVHFQENYERFKEIKEDEKLLSALYPKAIL